MVDHGRQLLEEEVHELVEVERHVADRMRISTAARCWSRLDALDFMNSSMQFSALALLCLFPFLTIVAAEGGGDVRPALIRRLGLDRQAAQDLDSLMSAGTHAAATLNVVGVVLVVLGAIGVASTLQSWYQKVYAQPARTRRTRQLAAQLLWLVGLVVYLALQDLLYRAVAPAGTRAAVYAGFFAIAAVFYWWTQHVLLLGRVRWRQLIPGALGTGVCVTGLTVFSTYVFSGQIVSSYHDYGSIGVVTVLLSYLIGFGVCLHIGAVVGQMWNEQHTPLQQASEAIHSEVIVQSA
jgi:membrane protein